MPIIKHTNRSFLREHPFADPISMPAPVQTRSRMYPGDEIVLYHKLLLPGDASASEMSDIKFVSAKVSIIAMKPNVFTEQFSREFLATRFFELDSFVVSFNNVNARIIPWGTDGYAPNLTVKQDRNFRLPSGDFRRQVNFFTTHTNATSTWEYWFYFPILFRWEYWRALLTADNDFFNAAQPQDGLNHWWYHYFVLGTWTLRSRLDLNVLVDGVPTIIRSELNLTNGVGDANDYNANPDYTLESIKTSKVGGALSNTPCFIYDNENTVMLGFTRKITPWAINEQAQVSAIVWIEPFEESGITARTRGSSTYQITPESVFAGLNISATDDDGIGLQDAAGNYAVYDNTGKGALVFFDAAIPERISVVAVIDYAKLKLTYPGITKFTLYTRIYDSMIINPVLEPRTEWGEEFKQDATLVSPPSSAVICSQREPQCAFNLDVYADEADTDDLKNDKSDFYQFGDGTISSVSLTLQKNDSTNCADSGWEDVETISDNSLGKFFAFGKHPDFSGASFEDDYGKKYTGLFLEWRKVLAAYDTGKYRMKIIKTDAFAVSTTIIDKRVFCLRNYNCNLINRTVRIETLNEGLRGTFGENDLTDYSTGWNGQLRLKGIFKFKGSGYVDEYNQYGESDFNKYKPIINEQAPKFILSLRPIPGWMDFVVSTNILQADEIKITSYNTSNRHGEKLIKVPVMNDGDFTPRDNNLLNPLSDVDISLVYGQNNLRKRNS